MKLTKCKGSTWDTLAKWQGKYKNFTVKISEASNNPYGRTVDYYWVFFNSEKYNKNFNSLWENSKFESMEEAEQYAMKWVDNFIKENKK